MSLARQHRQKVEAAHSAARPSTAVTKGPDHTYRLLQLKLAEDKRLLKSIESIARKIETKRTLLPYYDHWISAVLEHGRGEQDDLLITLMLWHLDTGSLQTGLRIADYALRHRLSMPQGHSRKVPTVVAEEIADVVRHQQEAGQPVDIDLLEQAIDLTDSHDMPDPVRAKLLKALAVAIEPDQLNRAISLYGRALALDPKCGVKTHYSRLLKQRDTASRPARPDGADPESDPESVQRVCPPSDYSDVSDSDDGAA